MAVKKTRKTIRFFALMAGVICLTAFFFNSAHVANSAVTAKKLFGSKTLPAAMRPRVHGSYARGCISGANAIPVDGPDWQTMRLSRNRRWGHPALVGIIEDLSSKAAQKGWNGLLVGDMSQPRGGPMLTGHRSHQIGLDADIWFMPMPDKRMSYDERENTSAISVLKTGTHYVDNTRWTRGHENLLFLAANYPQVERILVHPGVKKKLCDTVKGDRSWLQKIRPFWGHHYHFHLRIGCPKNSPGCKPQNPTPNATGCDKTLKWWFNVGLAPKKKSKSKKKTKKRRQITLSDLPNACETILNAPSRSLKAATHKIRATNFAAPQLNIPAFDARAVIKSKPIEKRDSTTPKAEENPFPNGIPVPTKNPAN